MSAALLRMWERCYGVLHPKRTGHSLARRIGAGVLTEAPVAAADGLATEVGADHTP